MPRLWLLSDPVRLPDPVASARRLPRGAAVLARGAGPAVLGRLARLARGRGLALLLGGEGRAALSLRAGLHVPDRAAARGLLPFLRARRGGAPWALLSVAVHGRAGMARGRRLRADCALLSPAFATASHPGARALGPLRWAALARALGRPAVALGGVGPETAGRLPRRGAGRAAGLAAIGALASASGPEGGLWRERHSVSRKSR
ncbi:thiamine phosphate synthase [Falsiroseomonas bella]|uniref:thiamine phosphate synthase n=1 Tax=Falsiroseomonas bella TaxID=2184016 RepID=UPI001E539617|nr:thiamine phosphate synthase [Falsiroseomonas bella]